MNDPSNPTASTPKLALSREEAAAVLGLSTVTIDRLVRRRLLFPCRATRRPIFPTWELDRFLRASTKEAEKKAQPRSEPPSHREA